ncbi:Rieske 2Fe-2S domain-containing protein [Hydrotalea sp.]|uniref:Rieske (2Fe-2S) protein n=1 Tax=Hydrotalea sp. TaxID=2881279 RepID=UPI00263A082C|nr:Rieske 2Fe-2S domain-containing protein [Hydrotalea sp.]
MQWGHQKETEWMNAGPILQWFEPGVNALKIIEVAGKSITIAQWNRQYFAFAKKCPHAGGILANGYIDATGCITCPLHHYKFNMATGRNVSGESYYLKTYIVKTEAGKLWIGIE